MDPYYPPPPPDEEQDTGRLCDIFPGLSAHDQTNVRLLDSILPRKSTLTDPAGSVFTPNGAHDVGGHLGVGVLLATKDDMPLGMGTTAVAISSGALFGVEIPRVAFTSRLPALRNHVSGVISASAQPEMAKARRQFVVDQIRPRLVVTNTGAVVTDMTNNQSGRNWRAAGLFPSQTVSAVCSAFDIHIRIAARLQLMRGRPASRIALHRNLIRCGATPPAGETARGHFAASIIPRIA